MMRLCATLLICLLGSLNTVHAAPGRHPVWSVGYHEMTFLDPLDLQPMRAIAFYPSSDREHMSLLEGYSVEGGSMQPLIVSSCLAELTTRRTEELKSLGSLYEN